MFSKFIRLEIREFFRSPQLTGSIIMKVFTALVYAYFAAAFIFGGFGLYFISLDEGKNPLTIFSQFFILYWLADLLLKYFLQNLPANNIKPLLTLNIPRGKITIYIFIKILLSVFNWLYVLFAIPFTILLIRDGSYSVLGVLSVMLFSFTLLFCNSCVNIFINKNQQILIAVFAVLAGIGALHYFGIISVTYLSEKLLTAFYTYPFLAVIPLIMILLGIFFTLKFIKGSLYLDKGLELKKSEGKTEDIAFLKRFGTLGSFINNDIRLISRSKTARNAALGSLIFFAYGFFTLYGSYRQDFMMMFVGIFATGGFIFAYGQRVPAWDSSYYPLMMTLNVPFREYLKAKWTLFVLFTVAATVVCSFYIFFSVKFYLVILAAGIYNIGVNSYLTLLAGAFNKKPIDLDAGRKAFSAGGQTFNLKLMLLLIPQLALPIGVFSLVQLFAGFTVAVIAVIILGVAGLLFRNKAFDAIVRIYKAEKYTTLISFGKVGK